MILVVCTASVILLVESVIAERKLIAIDMCVARAGPDDSSYSGNGGCGIAMATSESLTGPWRVQPLHIVDQFNSDEVYCAHTNPSAVFDEAGGVTLAFNAGFCHDTLETIGLASAPHWTGPYTLLDSEAILRNDDGTPHRCEDPHLWKSERGWHLLVHNQQGPQQEAAYVSYSCACGSDECIPSMQ